MRSYKKNKQYSVKGSQTYLGATLYSSLTRSLHFLRTCPLPEYVTIMQMVASFVPMSTWSMGVELQSGVRRDTEKSKCNSYTLNIHVRWQIIDWSIGYVLSISLWATFFRKISTNSKIDCHLLSNKFSFIVIDICYQYDVSSKVSVARLLTLVWLVWGKSYFKLLGHL